MSENNRENKSSYTSIDKSRLINPEIDEESPMFRRRRSDEEEEEDEELGWKAQNERPKPKGPSWKGESAKSVVYGGLDAIVTCFSLISSISSGGSMSSVDVLVLGIANLVADGISMGFGDYLSSSTEKEMAFREKDVTKWEVDHHGLSKIDNLIKRYQELGMDPVDATTVVNILSKYKNVMVEEEMTGQKGLIPPDEEDKPWKSGLVTFTSFLVFGCAPLLSFIVLIPFTDDDTIKFIGACILSVVALTLLGFAKAKISGGSYIMSPIMTVSNGVIAAAVAYAIGWSLRNLAGLEEP